MAHGRETNIEQQADRPATWKDFVKFMVVILTIIGVYNFSWLHLMNTASIILLYFLYYKALPEDTEEEAARKDAWKDGAIYLAKVAPAFVLHYHF